MGISSDVSLAAETVGIVAVACRLVAVRRRCTAPDTTTAIDGDADVEAVLAVDAVGGTLD